ncbi:MAG: hypothetical protein J5994_10860 [Ruminococcus sp.]|nr:hypothetical protein [Ruminococcus sp.]
MADNTGPGVYKQLEEYFETQCKNILKGVKKITKAHARNCKENIKRDSPVNTADDGKTHRVYKNGWRVSTYENPFSIQCEVHQYRRPYLTWLLEDGHLLPDGSRTKAQPHIRKNGEKELDEWFLELSSLEFLDGKDLW